METVSVLGGGVTTVSVSGLMSSGSYVVEIAAENSAGLGVYSDPFDVATDSERHYYHVTYTVNYLSNVIFPQVLYLLLISF